MKKNLFWPIYLKLEQEFKELSYYIAIDKKQLKTYSIKIADLILRTVSECENIAKIICRNENIKFKDKKGHIRKSIYFNEYIEKLNTTFSLDKKLVNLIYNNIDENTFDFKLKPFEKVTIKMNGKDKKIIPWYHAYNKIKHDRIKNYKKASIENLINALAGLFLLNIYFKNEVFYDENEYNVKKIIQELEKFSDVFSIEYVVKIDKANYTDKYKENFFNPIKYFETCNLMAVYILEYDKEIKTESDECEDFIDKLESSVCILKCDGSLEKKHKIYKLTNHRTICSLVASINKNK